MYTRVFNQILDSSLAEDWQARHVFEDLLKLADEDGVVDMTHEAIARRINVPLDIVVRCVNQVLTQPDPKSRTPDEDGRRLVPLDAHRDWGWRIVNAAGFRQLRNKRDRKDYMRKYMREKRASEKEPVSRGVNTCTQLLARKPHVDVNEDVTVDVNVNVDDDAREGVSRQAQRDNSALRQSVSMLAQMFQTAARDGGKLQTVMNHLGPLLADFDETAIQEAIAQHVKPGCKPWDFRDGMYRRAGKAQDSQKGAAIDRINRGFQQQRKEVNYDR